MSCYLRHIKHLLAEVGIGVTPENKKQIDRAIHQIVGVSYKDCPATWKRLKEAIDDEQKRQELIKNLRNALHRASPD